MAPAITLKDIPRDIMKLLTERAELNQRSVQGELRHLLEREFRGQGSNVVRSYHGGPDKATYHDLTLHQFIMISARAGSVDEDDFVKAHSLALRAHEVQQQVTASLESTAKPQFVKARGLFLDPKHGYYNCYVDLIHHESEQPAMGGQELEELFDGFGESLVHCGECRLVPDNIDRGAFYPNNPAYYEWAQAKIFW
jgi:hypothetical protein